MNEAFDRARAIVAQITERRLRTPRTLGEIMAAWQRAKNNAAIQPVGSLARILWEARAEQLEEEHRERMNQIVPMKGGKA